MNRNVLAVLIVIASNLMSGCSDTAPPARRVVDVGDVAVPSHEAFSPVELTNQPFSNDTALGQPGTLVLHDGLLWVVDYGGAPMLHAFEPTTGTLVWSGGLSGEGPGEFGSISSLGGSAPGRRLWAFDDNARRFTVIDTNQNSATTPEVAVVRAEGRLGRAIPMHDDAFFALHMLPPDSAHAIIIDRSGAIVRTEQWPLLGADSVPMYPRMLASGGSFGVALCARPEGDKLAVAYTGAGKIDFFDDQAKHVGEAEVPFPTDAVFKRNQSGELRASRRRRAQASACGHTDHMVPNAILPNV